MVQQPSPEAQYQQTKSDLDLWPQKSNHFIVSGGNLWQIWRTESIKVHFFFLDIVSQECDSDRWQFLCMERHPEIIKHPEQRHKYTFTITIHTVVVNILIYISALKCFFCKLISFIKIKLHTSAKLYWKAQQAVGVLLMKVILEPHPQSLCMKEWKRMGRKTWGNRPGLH